MQSPGVFLERRSAPRCRAAFTLWFQRERSAKPCGGWVVDLSPCGAAFLAMGSDIPAVGESIDLTPTLRASSAGVVRLPADFPQRGRVLRVEPGSGLTRRVAIEFDRPMRTPADGEAQGQMSVETPTRVREGRYERATALADLFEPTGRYPLPHR